MGILIKQLVGDLEEAMTVEGIGGQINLLPKGCTLEVDPEDAKIWEWKLPLYTEVVLRIFFYVDRGMSLTHMLAMQGEADHDLTTIEQVVIEDAFEWLFVEGKFDVQKAKEKGEADAKH